MHRRSFLLGALCAPAIIKIPGLLMPIKPEIILPDLTCINTVATLAKPLFVQAGDAITIGGVIKLFIRKGGIVVGLSKHKDGTLIPLYSNRESA